MHIKGLSRLVDLRGWVIDTVSFENKVLAFDMHCDGRLALECPRCGKPMTLSRKTAHRIKDVGMRPELGMSLRYEAPQVGIVGAGSMKPFIRRASIRRLVLRIIIVDWCRRCVRR